MRHCKVIICVGEYLASWRSVRGFPFETEHPAPASADIPPGRLAIVALVRPASQRRTGPSPCEPQPEGQAVSLACRLSKLVTFRKPLNSATANEATKAAATRIKPARGLAAPVRMPPITAPTGRTP